MKISVIATTLENYINKKENFDNFSGKLAGICYMASSFESLSSEAIEKTQRRINNTKINGHHSVYDHDYMTLYFEDVPKILAMFLNNEKMYTTSEKSGRYTKLNVDEKSNALREKWNLKFRQLIKEKYQQSNPAFFTDSRIEKLAFENTRYLTSIFALCSFAYTISYRQINILYCFLKELSQNTSNSFYKTLQPYVLDMISNMEQSVPYIDKDLSENIKNRHFSLISNKKAVEYYGDVYCTSYKCTFPIFAQSQRHRTIDYYFSFLETYEFYVPPILQDNEDLKNEWTIDMNSIKETFPQGELIGVTERGTIENFVLKLKERCCTFVQLEMNTLTHDLIKKYYDALIKSNHPQAEYLKPYTYGNRCSFPDYQCKNCCNFKDGINNTRLV